MDRSDIVKVLAEVSRRAPLFRGEGRLQRALIRALLGPEPRLLR